MGYAVMIQDRRGPSTFKPLRPGRYRRNRTPRTHNISGRGVNADQDGGVLRLCHRPGPRSWTAPSRPADALAVPRPPLWSKEKFAPFITESDTVYRFRYLRLSLEKTTGEGTLLYGGSKIFPVHFQVLVFWAVFFQSPWRVE